MKDLDLLVNVTKSPAGSAPTLTYTLQEVDPGNETSVFGPAGATPGINATGVYTASLDSIVGDAIKIAWDVTGTDAVFTGVYATILQKVGAPVALTQDPEFNHASIPASVSSTVLLTANAGRQSATVFNDSAEPMYLKLGPTVSLTSFTVRKPPYSTYQVPFGYQGTVTASWTSAIGAARVTEVRSPYSPQLSVRPPLPTTALEYWHAELQCTPTVWVGQVQGRVLTNQSDIPLVEPDTAPNSYGRIVAKPVVATKARWRNTAPQTFLPVGSLFYVFAVYRSSNAANTAIVTFSNVSTASTYVGSGAGNASVQFEQRGGYFVQGESAVGNWFHFAEYWIDGINQYAQGDSGRLFTFPNGGVATAQVSAITIGGTPSGSGVSTASIAFFLLATSQPSQAERDALKNWAKDWWGIPYVTWPASTVEYWHAERSCSRTAWSAQLRGTLLGGSTQNSVVPDGTYFKGNPVARIVETTSVFSKTGISPALVPAASYPYIFAVMRLRNPPPSGKRYMLDLGNGAAAAQRITTSVNPVATNPNWESTFYGVALTTSVPHDAEVHIHELWTEPGKRCYRLDGVMIAQDSVDAPAPTDWDMVRCGGLQGLTATSIPAASYAFLIVCSTKPTDAEIGVLYGMANTYWGTPIPAA